VKQIRLLILLCGILFFSIYDSFAQKYTLSGYIKDQATGEILIGASVHVKGSYIGTASNQYGFYSLTMIKGTYTIEFNYLGYSIRQLEINMSEDKVLNIELEPESEKIEEITVTAKRENENVVSTKMSNVKLSSKTIKQIPVLMGETDIIKTLHLLPGIKSTGGLSAGMSVRGSSRDQNLLMLDEATVYNAAHLGGIFSIFNNDAIKNIDVYKGAIPAEYGSRLASVLDIRMKDGNMRKYSGNGGIGLISSRLTVEGPIQKNKSSFIISGRRTYFDAIMKAAKAVSKSENISDFPIHFYDLNAKINHTINQNNRLYLSGYFGRDVFAFSFNENASSSFDWGNYTGTLRWNHVFSSKIFANFTLMASNYDYLMKSEFKVGRDKKTFLFNYDAFIKDYSAKIDFGYYLNKDNTLKFGAITTYHDINVGEIDGRQDTAKFNFKLPSIPGVENAFYIRNEQKIGNKLVLNYGVRYSMFFNPGENDINIVDDQYTVTGKKNYLWDSTLYQSWEPRIGATYIIDHKQSVKTSYSRTAQYLLIASNSTTGNPLDVWISSTPNIKPQISDQVSAGYFRNFKDNNYEASIEVYYKETKNQVAFKEFAQPQFNENIEEDLRFGRARAYGIEFLVRKPEGRLNGWIGYEYSKSERKIKDIQEKDWYLSPYDSPHDFTIVLIYKLNPRIDFSADWVWKTGNPLNAPSMRYEYGNIILPYYPGRNQDRMPNYHRMDLGMTIKDVFTFSSSKWHDELMISIYNAYFHKNADLIYFEQDYENPEETKAQRVTFIPFFPSLTYNFNF